MLVTLDEAKEYLRVDFDDDNSLIESLSRSAQKLCEVLTSPFAPVAEAGKPFIAFGDFKYYNIGDRGTRSFQELKELFAGNGMVGYVAKERVDGKLILPEAVQLLTLKGTASSGS